MLAWASLIFFISSQVSIFLNGQPQTSFYQSSEESARIASKGVLADQTVSFPTLTPTSSPTFTPTPTPETSTPTPTTQAQSQASLNTPSPTSAPVTTTNNWQSEMMGQVNSFRSSKGLASVSTNGETCSFAKTRLGEIGSGLSHDGFRQRLESNTLPYPSFSSVAENLAMHYDYTQVVQGWIDSPGHNENLQKDVPYGCVERNGSYFVYEAWKP